MPSVHLLSGDDDLLLQRATERLLDRLRRDDPELSVEVHDAAELDTLPEMRTQSLFGGHACVVLRGVGGNGPPAGLKAELEDYLAAPDDTAVLVLVARGTGRIQKIARLAREHGEVDKVDTPPDWSTDQWQAIVTGEFQRAGREVRPGVVEAILDHAGLDPSAIASKVAQVVAGSDATAVTVEDVEQFVEGHGARSGFELADAVADRDPAAAIALLRGMLEAGEEPLRLLGALTYRFRQLQQARAGAPVKGPAHVRERMERVARGHFSQGELGWCMDRLAQLDVDLKGNTDLPADLVIELAVIDLATAREAGAPWNPLATPA